MTHNSQELLNAFGRLFQNRIFASAALQSGRFGSTHHDPHGQSRGQARLIQLLASRDGISNAEIAEAFDIRPSSVSTLVKKLEEAGFIERRESEHDKRVLLIYLTEAGRKLVDSGREFNDDLSTTLFTSLTADEQDQLRALLLKVAEGLPSDRKDFYNNEDFRELFRQAHKLHKQFGRFGMRAPRNADFDRFANFGHPGKNTPHDTEDDFNDF